MKKRSFVESQERLRIVEFTLKEALNCTEPSKNVFRKERERQLNTLTRLRHEKIKLESELRNAGRGCAYSVKGLYSRKSAILSWEIDTIVVNAQSEEEAKAIIIYNLNYPPFILFSSCIRLEGLL